MAKFFSIKPELFCDNFLTGVEFEGEGGERSCAKYEGGGKDEGGRAVRDKREN